MEDLQNRGVAYHTNQLCLEFAVNGAWTKNLDAEKQWFPADQVIYSLGMESVRPKIVATDIPTVFVGDCAKIGKVGDAVSSAYSDTASEPNGRIVDLVGVKRSIIEAVVPVALKYGIRFTGGHPMARLAKAGYERAFADLYQGVSMILVPTKATAEGDIAELTQLFEQIGFGMVKVCDYDLHDKMIAHTSQLTHVVSVNYVKSPVSANYVGYTGAAIRI